MGIGENLAQNFLDQLDRLRKDKGDNLQIGDIDGLFKHLRSQERDEIYDGVKKIAEQIDKAKVELSKLHPEDISVGASDANLELDAVISETERAANNIMDAAEQITQIAAGIEDEALSGQLNAQATNLFMACDFQDITGQRISKVVVTLKDIDSAIHELLSAISDKVDIAVKVDENEEEDEDAKLMNGPQLSAVAPTQDDIDKLFGG